MTETAGWQVDAKTELIVITWENEKRTDCQVFLLTHLSTEG